MPEKKQTRKKQIKSSKVRDIGLRLTPQQIALVDRAVVICATRLGTPLPRYHFVLQTVIAAARKVVTEAGEKIPGEK